MKPKVNKKSPYDRVDKATMALRKRNIAEWLLEGNQVQDIVESIQKQWGIKERQAYYYLEDAFELLYQSIHQELRQRLAFHVGARLKLYKQIIEDTQLKPAMKYKLALDYLESIARLEGLHKERIEIQEEKREVIQLTLDLDDGKNRQHTIELQASVADQLPETTS